MTSIESPSVEKPFQPDLSNLSPVRKTGKNSNSIASQYSELLAKVKEAGLLQKKPSF